MELANKTTMTHQKLSKEEFEDGRVKELRGGDMELWSDGESIVRFGFNVFTGECVEIHLNAVEEFLDFVENCETTHESFESLNGSSKYLFECNHPNVHVYHQREHVASFTDYEKYPVNSIAKTTREIRRDWEPETVARSVIENHLRYNESIEIENVRGSYVTLNIVAEKPNHIPVSRLVDLSSIDGLSRRFSDGSDIESEEDFARAVRHFLEGISISVEEDSIVYRLKIETSKIVD